VQHSFTPVSQKLQNIPRGEDEAVVGADLVGRGGASKQDQPEGLQPPLLHYHPLACRLSSPGLHTPLLLLHITTSIISDRLLRDAAFSASGIYLSIWHHPPVSPMSPTDLPGLYRGEISLWPRRCSSCHHTRTMTSSAVSPKQLPSISQRSYQTRCERLFERGAAQRGAGILRVDPPAIPLRCSSRVDIEKQHCQGNDPHQNSSFTKGILGSIKSPAMGSSVNGF